MNLLAKAVWQVEGTWARRACLCACFGGSRLEVNFWVVRGGLDDYCHLAKSRSLKAQTLIKSKKKGIAYLRACAKAAKPTPPEHTTLPKMQQILPVATPSLLAVFHFKVPWLTDHRAYYKTLGVDEKTHLCVPSSIPHFHFLARNSNACCLLWFYVQMNFWAVVKRCWKLMAGDSHLLQPI